MTVQTAWIGTGTSSAGRRQRGWKARTVLSVLGLALASCGPGQEPREPQAGTGGFLIAHRGASAYAPEHTLAAYELALAQGADFIEPDLQITRDGHLIALHDETLERTTNVAETFPDRAREVRRAGRMVRRWYASDFSLEELKTLDAGSWFSADFEGQRIPTLGEVIRLARGRAGIYPETKSPESYADLGYEMERLLLAELERDGLARTDADPTTPVVIQSFSAESLRILREMGSDLPLTFLIRAGDARQWSTASGLGRVAEFASGIGPAKRILDEDPALVQRAHAVGLTVTPWTFAAGDSTGHASLRQEMIHFICVLGVDGLFTNNPDLFPRPESCP